MRRCPLPWACTAPEKCHLEENSYKILPEVCVDCHDEEMPKEILNLRKKWQYDYEIAKRNYKKVKTMVDKRVKTGRSVSAINPIFRKAE